MHVTFSVIRHSKPGSFGLLRSVLQNSSTASLHNDSRCSKIFNIRTSKLIRKDFRSTNPIVLRYASTIPGIENLKSVHAAAVNDSKSSSSFLLDPIPEPPIPLPDVSSVTEALKEPSFESLGFGGWTPIGLIQNCFEFLHVSCDLPWWSVIMIGTVVVRTLLFPVVVISQRNAAKMHNLLPEIQKLQLRMTDARERGDRLDAARYGQEMMVFMKEKGLNPFKNMLVPLCQAPLFISFFISLRRMSALPVESMKVGGLFWFADLTVPDQYYLLPLITSATLAITIEVGTDTTRLNSANLGMMKYALRAMPILIFPFTINFTNAILVYWCSTNFISLIQVSILKIPRVREFFKIEKLIEHKNDDLPVKDKGFKKGLSDSWTNMKLTRELEDREIVDDMNFRKAGRGPLVKTFKHDPTKPPPHNPAAIQAKKNN